MDGKREESLILKRMLHCNKWKTGHLMTYFWEKKDSYNMFSR